MYFFGKCFGSGESFFLMLNVPAIKRAFLWLDFMQFWKCLQIFIMLCSNSPGAKRCFSLDQQRIMGRVIK